MLDHDPVESSSKRAAQIAQAARTELLRSDVLDDRDAVDPWLNVTDPQTGSKYVGPLSGAPPWAKARSGYMPAPVEDDAA